MSDIEYVNKLPWMNLIARALWQIVCALFFRPFGTKIFRPWRNLLLRCFGAKVHSRAGVYSSAKIWCPWNLVLMDNAWIGPNVNCYNADKIIIGKNTTISQGTHLCTASHNITQLSHNLITAPIVIKDDVWVAADAFVGMGVTIEKGAVVGARAAVFKDVEPWTVVGGNPAKVIKKRIYEGK